jgi:methyl-accepting chemotaxis protein
MFASLVAAQIRDTQLSDKKLNRYQKQAEDLYNQKAELESQLENTTDPWVKQTINNQIKDIDTKINDIDQKVNQWQNTADEINKQLEEISSKSELPVQQSMPQQQ